MKVKDRQRLQKRRDAGCLCAWTLGAAVNSIRVAGAFGRHPGRLSLAAQRGRMIGQ